MATQCEVIASRSYVEEQHPFLMAMTSYAEGMTYSSCDHKLRLIKVQHLEIIILTIGIGYSHAKYLQKYMVAYNNYTER